MCPQASSFEKQRETESDSYSGPRPTQVNGGDWTRLVQVCVDAVHDGMEASPLPLQRARCCCELGAKNKGRAGQGQLTLIGALALALARTSMVVGRWRRVQTHNSHKQGELPCLGRLLSPGPAPKQGCSLPAQTYHQSPS